MVGILRPDGTGVLLYSLTEQVYSMEDEEGWQWHWSVADALRRAESRGEIFTVSLSEMGLSLERIRQQYRDLDEAYALTTDLGQPLLFVPFRGKHQLIDGWHRLFKAAVLGVDELLAYILSQEEADACLLCKLPPGEGVGWEAFSMS